MQHIFLFTLLQTPNCTARPEAKAVDLIYQSITKGKSFPVLINMIYIENV